MRPIFGHRDLWFLLGKAHILGESVFQPLNLARDHSYVELLGSAVKVFPGSAVLRRAALWGLVLVPQAINVELNEAYVAVEEDYHPSIGVFMTASEANRQRVFTLLRVESEQMLAQFNALDNEISGVKRAKPPMSEARQRWVTVPCDRIRSNAT